MRKRIILPTILLTGALAVGSLGFARAYAQENGSYPPIVQKLAERFGLKEEDVADVFEEIKDERMANMHAKFATRLDDAVADGKLTEEQKQKLLDHHEKMQDKMEEWKDLPADERHEKMKEFHEEFKNWLEENDIELPMMVFRAEKPFLGHGFKGEKIFLEKLD